MFTMRRLSSVGLRTTLKQLKEHVKSVQSLATPLLSVERSVSDTPQKESSLIKSPVVHVFMEKGEILRNPSTGLEEFELVYKCKKCNSPNNIMVTKIGYENGVIIVRCPGCKRNVILADNLGWFPDDKDESEERDNVLLKWMLHTMQHGIHEMKPKSPSSITKKNTRNSKR